MNCSLSWQVGDQHRGYLLEIMLTKLRYAAGEGNTESSSGESSDSSNKADPARGLQIIGMSATMPNVAAVADWLQVGLGGFANALHQPCVALRYNTLSLTFHNLGLLNLLPSFFNPVNLFVSLLFILHVYITFFCFKPFLCLAIANCLILLGNFLYCL